MYMYIMCTVYSVQCVHGTCTHRCLRAVMDDEMQDTQSLTSELLSSAGPGGGGGDSVCCKLRRQPCPPPQLGRRERERDEGASLTHAHAAIHP